MNRETPFAKPRLSTHPTLLALCISAAVGFSAPASMAQEAATSATTTANREARNYSIPAQPLSEALIQFGRQSGLQVSAESGLVRGKQAAAVSGNLSVEQALSRLLGGTGLRYRINGGMVSLVAAGEATVLAPVKVSADVAQSTGQGAAADAYRVESASTGALGEKSLKDTPYSVEVFSGELIENTQARSLADLAKVDASISLMPDNIVTENNALAIRGLLLDGDTGQKLDGSNIRLRASDLPLEHVERVEILKGATGFLSGFGQPGGIINYALKRPTDEQTLSFNTQVMDSGLFLLHGDVGGRIGADNEFGYRVNLVRESGDTYIDDGESRRHSTSVALDWRIAPGLEWRIDALSGEHVRKGGYWSLVPNTSGEMDWTAGEPLEPVDGDKRLAPSYSRYASIHKTIGTDLSWQFAEAWDLTLSHRVSDNGREYFQPTLFANSDGAYFVRMGSFPNRFRSSDSQALVSGELETGPVLHDITAGLAYTQTRNFWSPEHWQAANLGGGTIDNPQDFDNPLYRTGYKKADTKFSQVVRREAFISDTMHFGDEWDLVLGLRRGNLEDELGSYDRYATTPTVAVVYRPVTWLSTYASYIESLEQGNVAPADAANAMEVFDPMESEQREVGAKAEGENWAANAALFRLQRGYAYRNAETNIYTQNGEVRYEGLELSGKFRLSPEWLLNASATWLDATVEEVGIPALEGNKVPGVAEEQLSLFGEYSPADLPLTFTAGARYTGERPLDQMNQWDLGSVTLFDLGARYETQLGGNALTVRLNLDNVADEAYWVSTPENSYIQQGAPRTIKLGAQIDFF